MTSGGERLAFRFEPCHEALDQRLVERREIDEAAAKVPERPPGATFDLVDVAHFKRDGEDAAVVQVDPAVF